MESCVANNINASFPYECDFSYNWHVDEEPCKGDDIAIREFLKIDQGATTRTGEVLAKIKFLSPIDILLLESQDGCIHGADTLVDPIPSEVKVSFLLIRSNFLHLFLAASFNNYSIDPLDEISHKSVNFCISSRKFAKSNILNTPTAHSARISSVSLIKDKNNTQGTNIKHSSKRRIRNSSSTGSIRRPLQNVTNQMNE
ncbi:hypothetical protein IEQ34_022486 [Dendrobium chrysotoxum]|uniref:Uncharacterized protein n=1 Tax=Dendrobium chrysotoxum TaxID=161865 RepID=A0AAV7FXZ8_DENCH|nr:hypothetical protein IEQ34_022486 [Dendrobium chrysotoxum]